MAATDSAAAWQNEGHRNDLQGLRAVAVVLVVLAHAGVPHFAGGFVGVDVFFVLSGYLITGLLLKEAHRGGASIAEFYKRRARRILPAATLTLVTTTIAAYYLLNFVRARSVINDSLWAAFFAANIHFARIGTDYFAAAQPPSPIQHFWTLAVEEQFYLVWPILLITTLLVTRRRRHHHRFFLTLRGDATRRRITVLTVLAAAITATSLAASIMTAGSTSSYFSTFTRAWELGLGALLALASLSWTPSARAKSVAGITGIVAIVTAGVLYTPATKFPGYAALLPTLGAALVILAGIRGSSKVGKLLEVAPMRFIGDRSYTLYLWHWPFLILAELRVGHPLPVWQNLLLVAAALAVSVITYRYYENPLRHYDWSGQAAAFAFTSSAAVIVLVGAVALSAVDAKATALTQASAGSISDPLATNGGDKALAEAIKMQQLGAGGELQPVRQSANSTAAIDPATLVPPVGSLLSSEFHFPSGCSASGTSQTTSSICSFGDTTASRVMAAFGDSHTQMWMPALEAAASELGYKLIPFSKSGCNPARWVSADASAACRSWYGWATDTMKGLHPAVIVIAASYYGGGIGAGGDAYLDGFRDVVAKAADSARKVVVVSDPPKLTQQPVDCLLSGHATHASCVGVWTAQRDTMEGDLASTVKASGGVLMDTSGLFCSGTSCPMVVGNTIVYIDLDHITAQYATDVAAPFTKALYAKLRQRRSLTPSD